MEKNVSYKALLYILLGSVSGILAFGVNTSSKFNQINENKAHIEENRKQHLIDLRAVYIKLDKNNQTIKENQIELIKGLSRIELIVERNNK